MKTRFYYTLAEVFARNETDLSNARNPFYFKTNNYGFGELINGIVGSTVFTDDSKTKILMQEYIWPAMYNNNFMFIDVEHEPWEEPKKPMVWDIISGALVLAYQKVFIGIVYCWLKDTMDKYEKIIDIYDGQKANLMNKLESVSINKFNDTPQNNAIGYDDTHTTNASQTTTSTDPGTIMSRLNDVRYNWDNIYKEWASNFGRILQLGD